MHSSSNSIKTQRVLNDTQKYQGKNISYGTTSSGQHGGDENLVSQFDSTIEKSLLRKLESRMLLWAFFTYFAEELDRHNLRM